MLQAKNDLNHSCDNNSLQSVLSQSPCNDSDAGAVSPQIVVPPADLKGAKDLVLDLSALIPPPNPLPTHVSADPDNPTGKPAILYAGGGSSVQNNVYDS